MAEASSSPLSEKERELLRKLLSEPTEFPSIFRSWLVAYLEANPPLLPISQIVGFSQFLGNYVKASGNVTTTSTSYVSLTGGPELTALANGEYAIAIGCRARTNTSGRAALMSVSVNGATAGESDAAVSAVVADLSSVMSLTVATLDNGDSNTLEAKYRSSDAAATAVFDVRYLFALKIANV